MDAMQFGFIPGKGTIDVIFIAHQLQERYLEKKKKLFFVFKGLEKAFDQGLREMLKWDMRKLGVKWLVRAVMAIFL